MFEHNSTGWLCRVYLGFPNEFVCSSIILQVGYVGCIWGFPMSSYFRA